eukprot:411963_1
MKELHLSFICICILATILSSHSITNYSDAQDNYWIQANRLYDNNVLCHQYLLLGKINYELNQFVLAEEINCGYNKTWLNQFGYGIIMAQPVNANLQNINSTNSETHYAIITLFEDSNVNFISVININQPGSNLDLNSNKMPTTCSIFDNYNTCKDQEFVKVSIIDEMRSSSQFSIAPFNDTVFDITFASATIPNCFNTLMVVWLIIILRVLTNSIKFSLHKFWFILSIFFCISTAAQYEPWISGSMIQSCQHTAAAYDAQNNTIFLFGGSDGISVVFNVEEERFYDMDWFVPVAPGYSKNWIQIKETVWMIDFINMNSDNGRKFASFNIETEEFQNNFRSILLMQSVGQEACLAYVDIDDGYLAVIGGKDVGPFGFYLKTVQILNLTSNQWLPNIPDIQIERHQHSCIGHRDVIYVIGGLWVSGGEVEIFNLSKLIHTSSEQWNFMEPLPVAVAGASVVIYDDDILVLGGHYDSLINDRVMIIQTNKYNSVVYGGTLDYADYYMTAVVAYPLIYIFGGNDNPTIFRYNNPALYSTSISPTLDPSNAPTETPTQSPTFTEKIIYVRKNGCDYGYCTSYYVDYHSLCINGPFILPQYQQRYCCVRSNLTLNPTSNPTPYPTFSPTLKPTLNPTIKPTLEPTLNPTSKPTLEPTLDPSIHPTINPTLNPTPKPTLEPTLNPSIHPTKNPTVNPVTNAPTLEPTLEPTYIPTYIPTFIPTFIPILQPTMP